MFQARHELIDDIRFDAFTEPRFGNLRGSDRRWGGGPQGMARDVELDFHTIDPDAGTSGYGLTERIGALYACAMFGQNDIATAQAGGECTACLMVSVHQDNGTGT